MTLLLSSDTLACNQRVATYPVVFKRRNQLDRARVQNRDKSFNIRADLYAIDDESPNLSLEWLSCRSATTPKSYDHATHAGVRWHRASVRMFRLPPTTARTDASFLRATHCLLQNLVLQQLLPQELL